MGGCSADKCFNRTEKGFKMYSIPRHPEKRLKWAIKAKKDLPNMGFFCEVHFEEDQFRFYKGKRQLIRNAVPTLFANAKAKKRRRPPMDRSLPRGPVSKVEFQDADPVLVLHDHPYQTNKPDPSSSSSIQCWPAAEVMCKAEEDLAIDRLLAPAEEDAIEDDQNDDELVSISGMDTHWSLIKIRNLEAKVQALQAQNEELSSDGRVRLPPGFLNSDQRDCLQIRSLGSSRSCFWSEKTIRQAIKIRRLCGSKGYAYLRSGLGYPLPSQTTLIQKTNATFNSDEDENKVDINFKYVKKSDLHQIFFQSQKPKCKKKCNLGQEEDKGTSVSDDPEVLESILDVKQEEYYSDIMNMLF